MKTNRNTNQDTTVCCKTKFTTEDVESREVLKYVANQLELAGGQPVQRIAGYLVSGDPGYITARGDARIKMTKLDRYDILARIVAHYIDSELSSD